MSQSKSVGIDAALLEAKVVNGKPLLFLKHDAVIGRSLRAGKYWERWMAAYINQFYRPGTNVVDIGAQLAPPR